MIVLTFQGSGEPASGGGYLSTDPPSRKQGFFYEFTT